MMFAKLFMRLIFVYQWLVLPKKHISVAVPIALFSIFRKGNVRAAQKHQVAAVISIGFLNDTP